MPRRWVVTPVIGTGTKTDPYRAEVIGQPGVRVWTILPSNPDGTPKFSRTLAVVQGTGPALQAAAAALPNTRVIPGATLDDTLSQLTTQQRTFLRNLAEEVGFNYQAQGYTGTTPVRRVLRDLGQFIEPAFRENLLEGIGE